MGELADRRTETDRRFGRLRARLRESEVTAKGKASVFATGSFGRREAGTYSDLDLFIVGKRNGKPGPDGKEGSLLKRLDEICIKADLIKATRALGIPDFSGEGRYLTHFSVHEFTKTLGTPEDDVTNTFTARLLLLLESRPLLESVVYGQITKEVIDAYWRDYEDHKNDFVPAFLGNDILRLWRTFCVNYEARTERIPRREKARGKLKNYKLKHSRLLTCYSALLYLLAVYGKKRTVSPSDAVEMISFTPTERLEWLLEQPGFDHSRGTIKELLGRYEAFLEITNTKETTLVQKFMSNRVSRAYMGAAYEFGDLIFEALSAIGGGNRFHRLLVV